MVASKDKIFGSRCDNHHFICSFDVIVPIRVNVVVLTTITSLTI